MSPLAAVDDALFRALYAGPATGPLALVFGAITWLGSGWMVFAVAPLLASRAHRAWALRLLGALAVTATIVFVTKATTGRVRPCHALAWAPAVACTAPTDPSFPSGHAAGSFAFAAFVLAGDRRRGLAALAIAALVAMSRVILGVHWPSDVVAGALLGALIGAAWASAHPRRRADDATGAS